jgi:hypothetical protein
MPDIDKLLRFSRWLFAKNATKESRKEDPANQAESNGKPAA